MEMHKLRCGIIYTTDFADFLKRLHATEHPAHPDELLSLDYIRLADGPKAGTSWLQITWVSPQAAPEDHRHLIGDTEVFIQKQSRRGLTNRLLHFADGKVVVKE
jgi:hypothetical protein